MRDTIITTILNFISAILDEMTGEQLMAISFDRLGKIKDIFFGKDIEPNPTMDADNPMALVPKGTIYSPQLDAFGVYSDRETFINNLSDIQRKCALNIMANQFISAIKVYRNEMGCDLRTAKEEMEDLRDRMLKAQFIKRA